MTKAEKTAVIADLKEKFSESSFFYITDASSLTVAQVNKLRALCFEKGVELKVVKNTLAVKALQDNAEEKNYTPLFEALKGPTSIMFSDVGNVPAKIIKEFRKTSKKPVLKAAYIDSDIFFGDDQVEVLSSLKSKEDLIGDVILLLQSPIKNVIGSLQSGGQTISGLLKALEEKGA